MVCIITVIWRNSYVSIGLAIILSGILGAFEVAEEIYEAGETAESLFG